MIPRLAVRVAALVLATLPFAWAIGSPIMAPGRVMQDGPASSAGTQVGLASAPVAARPWPTSTESLPAQLWIELAMARLLAGDPDGAAEGFRTAQRHDPACAICFWGEALAAGALADGSKTVSASLDAALALVRWANDKEAALIAALERRVRGGGHPAESERTHVAALRAVATRFPDDQVIADLAAGAGGASRR